MDYFTIHLHDDGPHDDLQQRHTLNLVMWNVRSVY